MYTDSEYLFVEFISGINNNNKLGNALKKTFKLNDKNSDLYLLAIKIINQFNKDPNKGVKTEFIYIILPESDKDLKVMKKDYPTIHIFTDNRYYDNTYSGKMVYNGLKKKLLVVYLNFSCMNMNKYFIEYPKLSCIYVLMVKMVMWI